MLRLVEDDATRPLPRTAWAFSALGIRFRSDLDVLGSTPAAFDRGGPPPCDVRLVSATAADLRESLAGLDARPVLERKGMDGTLHMRVETFSNASYRVYAPGHGEFLVSNRGSVIQCAPDPTAGWRWQRPFFAQVVPLAAALNGHEVMHASSVVLDRRCVAFTGNSGAGKTSLAVHLTARGAALVADDVLALDRAADDTILAHPGVPIVNVAVDQLASLSARGRERLGPPLGQTDKIHLTPRAMVNRPVPLDKIYFLIRRRNIGAVSFERLDPPSPQLLMGSTFLPHVTARERLLGHLGVYAGITHSVRVYRLLAPVETPADALAAHVERHAKS